MDAFFRSRNAYGAANERALTRCIARPTVQLPQHFFYLAPIPTSLSSPLLFSALRSPLHTANMVATTRTKTGSIPAKIEAALAPPAANTSKPRDKKVASGRVAKPKATPTKKTATGTPVKAKTAKKEKAPATKAKDKVVGKAEKAVGKAEGKPAKKVCVFLSFWGARRRAMEKCAIECVLTRLTIGCWS